MCDGSNSTSTTSACPVLSVQTSSYVGFSVVPPTYPTAVDNTPFKLRKVSSTPQKQPAPNVAFSVCIRRRCCVYSRRATTRLCSLVDCQLTVRMSETQDSTKAQRMD